METKHYLLELYRKTKGDLATQVSMFEVGNTLRLEKKQARKVAEDLIGEGLVQVKTLSGGIGITQRGIEAAQAAGGAEANIIELDLGKNAVLDKKAEEIVTLLLEEIRHGISRFDASYEQIEALVIDLKTIEVQLLSPRPKTAIIREVLRSVHTTLQKTGQLTDITKKLKKTGAV